MQKVPNGKKGVKVRFSYLDIISTRVYNFEKPVDIQAGGDEALVVGLVT